MVQAYQPLELNYLLNRLRETRFTGLICCRPEGNSTARNTESGQSDVLEQCFLVFRSGQITYGDTALPNVSRLAGLLAGKLQHSLIRTAVKLAMEQCQKPYSLREFLTRLVATKITSWEQIEAVAQQQTEAVLQQISSRAGSINQTPSDSIDISFGVDQHGLDWSRLMQALEAGAIAQQAATQAASQATPSPLSQTRRSVAQPRPGQNQSPTVISSPTATSSGQPTVLSVDDSPIAQQMIQRALGQVCNVLLANSALTALQMLNSNGEIELVFLDVNMPGVDGIDFCRAVRSIPKFKTLPIIMLTANEGRVNKLKGQIAGSTLYLNKSVGDQKLIEVVHQYTRSSLGSPPSTQRASPPNPSYSLA